MVTAIFGAASIIGLHFLYAQDTMIPFNPVHFVGMTNITTLGSLTDAQLEQLIRVLAATPTILPGVLPAEGWRDFLFIAESRMAPLPVTCDRFRLGFWNYFYLLDDLM